MAEAVSQFDHDRVDKRQLKTLLKIAYKTDLRGSNNPFRGYGQKQSNFPPILGLIVMKLFLGLLLSAIMWKLDSPFFGAMTVNIAALVFISLTILLEFSNLIISPDDYPIISPHPVNSKTFFFAKAIHFVVYVTILATAIIIIPSVVAAVRFHTWWLAPVIFVSSWGMAMAASLFFILFYTIVLKVINRDRMQRLLGYAQLVFVTVIYAGYIVLPRMIEKVTTIDVTSVDVLWIYFTPPAWFAAWPALSTGDTRLEVIIAAITGIVALTVMARISVSRLSMEYAVTLNNTVEQMEKSQVAAPKSFFARLVESTSSSEDRAVWKLIRAQFKYDNRFKMTVLSILPLTIFYIFMGLQDGGKLIDPFIGSLEDSSGSRNYLLYVAVGMLPFMIIMGTAYSPSAAASWVFFASPANKTNLVMSAARFTVVYFCIPYLLLLTGILGYFFGNYLHGFLHCFILFLMLLTLVRVFVLLMPNLPFSIPVRAGQRGVLMAFMFLIPTVFIVVPMVIITKLSYGGVIGYSLIAAGLILIWMLFGWIMRRSIPKRVNKLEYAEST